MTARRLKDGNGKEYWAACFTFKHPDGRKQRFRAKSQVPTKQGAEDNERLLRNSLLAGTYGRKITVAPTLAEFEDRFFDEWCAANKQKPSGIEGKHCSFRNYLIPLFGDRRLDTFTALDEDRLKKHLRDFAASTYNNAASALNSALKAAERWKVIEKVPHRFMLLKRQKSRPKFYDFDQYQWLVEAAEKIDPAVHVLVLLGGDAGLRRGEIIALEWPCVDLRRGLITVERSEWQGKVTETKGMKYRVIPMTSRLKSALASYHHLRGARVLYTNAGKTVTAKPLKDWMVRAQKRAQLPKATGDLHILRHTFCSHLAMRGAPALSIQKLAGHDDLQTTLGYMHLAQGETDRAIRLLEGSFGSSVAADSGSTHKTA